MACVLVSAGIELILFLVAAVFRVLYENKVDNMLMFWLLLSSAYPKPRAFQCPGLCQ